MPYRVVFEFSPLYELVSSLELFLFRKSIKNVELGTEWIQEVQKVLDLQKIDFRNPKEVPCFDYLYLLLWQSPEKEDVGSFIKWLNSLLPGDLYEKLFSYVSEALPADLTSIVKKYIDLLKVWNDFYFSNIDQEILDILRESVIYWEGRGSSGDSVSLVDQVSGGIRIEAYEGLEQVILIPAHHMNPLIVSHKFKNLALVLYPVDKKLSDTNQPPKKLERITKALADDNRLRIIKLVKEGPKTFTEIQQHFNISKSTIHHHVMLLRTAGLISACHTKECCSETFVYRPQGILDFNELYNEYINK